MSELLRSPLHDVQAARSATFQDYFGWEIVKSYGDPRAEYDALVRTAGVLDVSYAGKFRVLGRDRVRYLNSMLSNESIVARLSDGISLLI
jgi:glycine cleavage system aminomethyltransferase T